MRAVVQLQIGFCPLLEISMFVFVCSWWLIEIWPLSSGGFVGSALSAMAEPLNCIKKRFFLTFVIYLYPKNGTLRKLWIKVVIEIATITFDWPRTQILARDWLNHFLAIPHCNYSSFLSKDEKNNFGIIIIYWDFL